MSADAQVIDLMAALQRSLNGAAPAPADELPAQLRALLDDDTTGVFGDVPDDFYHGRIDRASNSRLKTLGDKTPAHMRWEADHPKPATPAKKLGQAIHLAILQPDIFAARYAIAGQCAATKRDHSRCTNNGTARYQGHWFCGVQGHAPKEVAPDAVNVLEAPSWDACLGISEAVQANPTAKALLEGAVEQTALWKDPETGLPMKARFDVVNRDLEAIVDAKSTESAHPDDFERSIYRFKYYRQAGLYLDGAEVLGVPVKDFVMIAFEKEPPYGVICYRVRGDAIYAGREELAPLKKRYAECRRSGVWPGYDTAVRDISLSPFAFKQIDEKRERGLIV